MTRPAALLAALLALLLVPAAHAATPAATTRAIDREMDRAGRSSGALVVDLSNGVTLYSSRPDTQRIPASVNKLNTTAAALVRYGAAGTFLTPVLATAAPDAAGVLRGSLWLRGAGDPTFGPTAVRALAESVADLGVTRITGRVRADETLFDTLRGPHTYAPSAWVSPLSAVGYGRPWSASPARTAALALVAELRRAGVRVSKTVSVSPAPPEATPLTGVQSPTMAEIVARANVPSDNYVAEMLAKGMGAAFGAGGTTREGASVIRTTIRGLGARAQVTDGSGLSRWNRIAPRQVVRLLTRMADDPVFVGSLPVAGRSGTLSTRLRRTPAQDACKAKTGSLIGVSALAGYCDTAGGARVAFAFLMNGVSTYWARALQDRMVAAIAAYDAGWAPAPVPATGGAGAR
jgi:D-alanyl-D-alanine carboxypeptidase/D-alanyl-D-alanine-endopeptidase (penicillin-binding protein 4)